MKPLIGPEYAGIRSSASASPSPSPTWLGSGTGRARRRFGRAPACGEGLAARRRGSARGARRDPCRRWLRCQPDPLARQVACGRHHADGDRESDHGGQGPCKRPASHPVRASRPPGERLVKSGNSRIARAPRPSRFSIVASPPQRRASSRAIGRPRPVPGGPVRCRRCPRWKRSKTSSSSPAEARALVLDRDRARRRDRRRRVVPGGE